MTKPTVITVSINKGGAGKTTTAVHIAAWLAQQGRRVLLADLDRQGQCATVLGVPPAPRIYDLLVRENIPLSDLTLEARPNLRLLASNPETVIAQDFARLRGDHADLLERRVVTAAAGYDYIVFDTPPQGLLQECAVYSADVIVLPVPVDYLGMDGAVQFGHFIDQMRSREKLPVVRVLAIPMFVDMRTNESRANLAELEKQFGDRLLPSVPVRTRMREAIAEGKTIFEYAPREDIVDTYARIVSRIEEDVRATK